MSTIVQNKKGLVMTDRANVKIPSDRTALSMLRHNPFQNGDEFRSDGFVYNNGKKVRKWFSSLGHQSKAIVWEPKLNDLKAMEALRWKGILYLQNWFEKASDPFFEKLRKIAKNQELQCIFQYGEKWFKVTFRPTENSYSANLKAVSEKTAVLLPVNGELGKEYYTLSRRTQVVARRKWLCGVAFKRAFDTWQYENDKAPVPVFGKILKLNINGRVYWFQGKEDHWEKLCWPEEQPTEFEI